MGFWMKTCFQSGESCSRSLKIECNWLATQTDNERLNNRANTIRFKTMEASTQPNLKYWETLWCVGKVCYEPSYGVLTISKRIFKPVWWIYQWNRKLIQMPWPSVSCSLWFGNQMMGFQSNSWWTATSDSWSEMASLQFHLCSSFSLQPSVSLQFDLSHSWHGCLPKHDHIDNAKNSSVYRLVGSIGWALDYHACRRS